MSEPEYLTCCPACCKTMSSPIFQCAKGHSLCGNCVTIRMIKLCCTCKSPITSTRNLVLEEIILKLKDVTLKVACKFASKGCQYEIRVEEKDTHQRECRYRTFECEGALFCGWTCNWQGDYTDVLQHFNTAHPLNCWMEFKSDMTMKLNLTANLLDIQIIDYSNGHQLFWYKHKTDIKKEKVYWVFQYVGLEKQAEQYFYEFEIYDGPTRKFKVTEICETDCMDPNLIFESEKCVAISFKTIRNYLDELGQIAIRYRIMKVKKEVDAPRQSTYTQHYTPIAHQQGPQPILRNKKNSGQKRK